MQAPNLPAPPTPLIGRAAQLAELAVLLGDPATRLITLVGPPGVGKTRLGLEVVADRIDGFADGVRFVPLASLEDADLVMPALATALGLTTARSDPREAVEAHLRERHTLVLLDNFEQVLGAATDLAELVRACPGLTVLVTSRVALGLSGEYTYRVPPLPLPDPVKPLAADRLASTPAVALFIERARAVRRDFEITDENAEAIAEICRRLDGLPLAIELAAVRAKLLGPRALLARLDHQLAALGTGGPDRPPRQQTLRAALEWSYGLLPSRERRLFRALGVFQGGCTMEAVTAVCEPGDETGGDLLDRLETLVDHSLLQVEIGRDGEPRFSMLHVVREFALDRLRREEGEGAPRARHAAHYRTLAEAMRPDAPEPRPEDWAHRLDEVRDDLRAALAWALETGDAGLGLALGAALWRYWEVRGYLTHGRKWLAAFLDLPGGHGRKRAEALCGAGVLARFQGEVRESRSRLAEAVESWRSLGDRRGLADALTWLGMAEHYVGDFEAARERLDEALSYWRNTGDREGLARALSVRAGLANHEGDHETAEAMRHESLELYRAMADREGVGQALLGLGEVARCRADLDGARDRCREALAVFRELADRYHQGAALHNLGYIERRRGKPEEALACFLESLEVWEEIGHRFGIASCMVGLAGVQLDRGAPREAARLLAAADRRQRELGISMTRADGEDWDEIRAGIGAALGEGELRRIADAGAARPLSEILRAARSAAPFASREPAGPGPDTPGRPTPPFTAAASSLPETSPEAAPSDPGPPPETDVLTDREIEVVRLLAEGLTYAEIGHRLFISPRTVDAHLRSIYPKLGVHSRHTAVRTARRLGLLDPPSS